MLKYHYSNPKFDGKPWEIDKTRKKKKLSKREKREKKKLRQVRKRLRRAQYENIRKERSEAEVKTLTYLKDFWPRFSAAQSESERLALLKAAADRPGWRRVSEELRKYLRQKFSKIGWRLLDIPVEKCGVCDNPPEEKHHIIPLYFGGINANDNLLMICCQCHDSIHPWMKHLK